MYRIQHTHKLATTELLPQPPILPVSENGYLENLDSKDFHFHSENINNVPVWLVCVLRVHRLCVVRESPEDRGLDRVLETRLLETEVTGVDFSVCVSTTGFSSPCGVVVVVVVSAWIVLVQLHTRELFIAGAPFILRGHRMDGWVKYWSENVEIIPPKVCLKWTCFKARWLANISKRGQNSKGESERELKVELVVATVNKCPTKPVWFLASLKATS